VEKLNTVIEELRREGNGIESILRKQVSDISLSLDLKNTELIERNSQLDQESRVVVRLKRELEDFKQANNCEIEAMRKSVEIATAQNKKYAEREAIWDAKELKLAEERRYIYPYDSQLKELQATDHKAKELIATLYQ
jgi:hypothetical protein